MQRLGERIRNRRESLNIQINSLANAIGVTPSLISQIERAKAFPSIITLKKIAETLQTTVGNLIGENETYSINPLVRFSDKKIVQMNEQGAALYLLSNHGQQKSMEPCLMVLPGGSAADNLIHVVPGQSFYFVLQGMLKITIENQEYALSDGDSFYFNAKYKHTLQNSGETEAMVLWISTNPVL